MLVEDTTAFVVQLEVSAETPSRRRLRFRVLEAEFNVLKARHEVDVAANALEQVDLALRGASSQKDRGRERSLLREQRIIRKHLHGRREELAVCQQKLDQLRAEAKSDLGRAPATFRLHAGEHSLGLSERQFARLSRAQRTEPVLVTKTGSRRWWWYLDRFWWGDKDVSARDVEDLVLRRDMYRKVPSDPQAEASLSDSTRLAVWSRDQGRCVDCGSSVDLLFDEIIQGSGANIDSARNVELRCRPCRDRRDHNEARTRVANARFDATPYQRSVA
jgi:hypothetical protein